MYKPRFLVNTYINPRILDIFEEDSIIASTCIHEAGHAVFYTILGGQVISVTVNPDGSGFTRFESNHYQYLDTHSRDMFNVAGFFFHSLVCGRYEQPFPEIPLFSPDIENTITGNVDKVIDDLERFVILNNHVVKAVEDTAIVLFRSGLRLNGNEIREIWNNAYKIK